VAFSRVVVVTDQVAQHVACVSSMAVDAAGAEPCRRRQ